MRNSIKENYIYNLLYQVLIMVLPLVITPYLSRVLGAEQIGIYSFTLSILSYFVLFGCLGINLYGQRLIASLQDNKEKQSKIFYELFILKFIMITISFVVFAFVYFNDVNYSIYYKILTIELFSNVFDITWFYQGLEDFKKITIRNTIVKLTSTLLILLIVKNESDLIKYFLIYTISNFFGFLILWVNLKKYVIKVKFSKLNIVGQLKPTISFFLPQIAIQIYTVLDKTMLGAMINDMAEVGYYEQSQKIVKTGLTLITALGTVMVPRIASLYAQKSYNELDDKIFKAFKMVSFIAFPLCFGIIGIANNFVPWFFGDGFLPAVHLLIIFSFLLIAIGFNNITGIQYLISTGKQNIFTVSVIIGAVLNFLLNLLLIPTFKANGAAIASVLAEFLILIFQIIYLWKTFDFKKIFKENIKYLLFSLIMVIPVYLVGTFFSGGMISTIIQVIVGVVVYFILLVIFKDKILAEIFTFIKKILIRR